MWKGSRNGPRKENKNTQDVRKLKKNIKLKMCHKMKICNKEDGKNEN